MGFLNTIMEYDGVVADVRPRYWAAHCHAVAAVGSDGPPADEFWRLVRTGAPDGRFVPYARTAKVLQYARLRDERIHSTELMALDEALPDAAVNLKVLKSMGTCHLVSLCPNREGLNAALDRMELWMYFDQKQALPVDRDRRVKAIRDLVGGVRTTLAVAGSVAFAYAASEAGCRVVGMKTGTAYPQQMRQVGVDVFFGSLDELTDALSRHDPQLQRIGVP